ncbi:FapA family protein [Marispirochaeta aestuarii]|uniref:FapA family protein n=1 Tax=Marispirochaeta aestuarii TaxID=1963862 RepID=UPI002ABDF6B6|nr:FapA family protein [Marispirochaeta aestuarii]
MVGLSRIREYMRSQAEEDKTRRSVNVSGPSIEDALTQASIELGIPLKDIEYELLEPGSRGTFGIGRKDCILIAYKKAEEQLPDEEALDIDLGFAGDDNGKEETRNGDVFVRLSPEGILLKVSPPVGGGKKATERQALDALDRRGVSHFDKNMIAQVVKQSSGDYIPVGEYAYNPANDPIMTVDITDFEMKAYIVVRPPGEGGSDLSYEVIENFLKNNGIIHGLRDEAINAFIDRPVYNESILVAEGTKPQDGEDARILYNFERDSNKIQLKEKNGKVDFKEQNIVQNVVEGQVLARKVPAGEGKNGRSVTGKLLPAKNGKDVNLGIGKNVNLSEDGMTAVAAINGQVVIVNDKLNVEPIHVVNGSVNLKTGGNVVFLGTVYVKGGVEDGFKVKAAGNIEVVGNVGKCELDAEGDIIIHQGVNGRGGGTVRAGRTVWAKFIENSSVESGENVVVSDGIINSSVDANQRIICQGKRATIVGGHLRASEEVHAKNIGSVAGAETVVEVGYDPKSIESIQRLEKEIKTFDDQLEEIELNIHTLENIKKMKKALPEEKEQYLEELQGQQRKIEVKRDEKKEEIKKIQEYLASLKVNGKVSASGKVYPGVKVVIKDASLKIRNEFKNVTFINELNEVKVTKYEALEEDFSKNH